MHTEKDIYSLFRKVQSEFLGRPYRLPKNWDEYFVNKMTKPNRDALVKLTDRFNTRWANINPRKFFEVGFDLFNKAFTYIRFFDDRIISLYIQRDKNQKREEEATKEELLKSFMFIKKYIKTNNLNGLIEYARIQNGFEKQCILDYKHGNISKFIILYLINKQYIEISKEELNFLPFLNDDVYGNMHKMLIMKNFIQEMENRI